MCSPSRQARADSPQEHHVRTLLGIGQFDHVVSQGPEVVQPQPGDSGGVRRLREDAVLVDDVLRQLAVFVDTGDTSAGHTVPSLFCTYYFVWSLIPPPPPFLRACARARVCVCVCVHAYVSTRARVLCMCVYI